MSFDVQTIRSSFELVKPIANDVMQTFYETLFTDYPEVRGLFKHVEIEKQKMSLLGSLVAAVDNLDNPEVLTKYLLDLGKRHVRYKVKDEHYQWVGAAFLKALKKCLGDVLTPELEAQWAEFYGLIAEAMMVGARNGLQVAPDSDSREGHGEVKKATLASVSLNGTVNDRGMTLPKEVKDYLHQAIDQHVRHLVDEEIQLYFAEQMRKVAHLSPEEIVRRAG